MISDSPATALHQIYLFDMDSVLLYPGGYRAALIATINHFSQALGLGELAPTPAEIEIFEAAGITSEWDSAPIVVVALSLTRKRPDYAALVQQVRAEWHTGEFLAEAAYRVFKRWAPSIEHRDWETEVLLQSRHIHQSAVLALFQQYTLGPAFEATYGLPRTIDSEALLLKHDQPVLARPVPPHSVIYTARPSKPPRDVEARLGYAPEAELGAQRVGLSHLPIVGFGSFQWLSEVLENGTDADHYLKPSPVHGLAAIGAALGGSESQALRAAEAAARGEWLSPLKELRAASGRVTVFEDSAPSISGVREAVRLLGEGWVCVGVGISTGGPKREALIPVADRIYPALNEALEAEVMLPAFP